MMKWCAWCQQFLHELPPYDNFGITHGLCPACEAAHPEPFAMDVVKRAIVLGDIFEALQSAGQREDVAAATRIVDDAIAANCRPIDILLGMISPMLYEVGEAWKRGALSVEEEHRFTAFSKQIVALVEARMRGMTVPPPANATHFFLMNAPGNRHELALRILSIWLEHRDASVRVLEHDLDQDTLLRDIAAARPRYLLISMALIDQSDAVAAIAAAVQALPEEIRPKTVVGGYPVKTGLVRAIPDAELVPDISALEIG
jgi:methanogenic corrinoid protein MtbC1